MRERLGLLASSNRRRYLRLQLVYKIVKHYCCPRQLIIIIIINMNMIMIMIVILMIITSTLKFGTPDEMRTQEKLSACFLVEFFF